MRVVRHGLLVFLMGTAIAGGAASAQDSPSSDAASMPGTETTPPPPTPQPPAAVAPAAPVPLPIMTPNWMSGLRRPEQPPYGGLVRPTPAQDVAMLEAGQPIFATDPRVAVSAVLLTQLTAVYVEDAPRIAELTVGVVQKVRAANLAASPLEMLVGATQWNGPGGSRGNVPRKFEQFARLYGTARLEGKDHTSALSLMQALHPAPSPMGAPVP